MKFLVCILFLGLAAAGIVEVEDCGKYCTTYNFCTVYNCTFNESVDVRCLVL